MADAIEAIDVWRWRCSGGDGLRGMRGQLHCLPEEKGAVESERRRFMGQVTGEAHPGGMGTETG